MPIGMVRTILQVVETYARMFLVLDLGVGSTYRQFLFSIFVSKFLIDKNCLYNF